MRRVEIVGSEKTQLFPPKRGIVGQGEHEPIPQRFAFGCFEDRLPLLIGGNPRQFGKAREQTALAPAKCFTWGVASPTDRVGFAASLLHLVVVEETDGNQPLLERCIGQPHTRLQGDEVSPTVTRTMPEIAHVVGNLGSPGDERINPISSTNHQVIRQPACVCLNGAWRQAKIDLKLKPVQGVRARGHDWPAIRQRSRIHTHPRYPPFPQRGSSPRPSSPEHYGYYVPQITQI